MYLLIFSFYLTSLLSLSQSNELSVNDVDVLIKNLFDNLAVDPYLQDMENIEETEAYVDKQIKSFLYFFKASGKERGKRSLHLESLDNLIEDGKGVYEMNELKSFKTIPAEFPRDIELFEHNKIWYAAVLESNGPADVVTSLTIYAYKDGIFVKSASVPTSGVDLAIHAGKNVALVVIAKNSGSKKFREKSAIFQYDYGTKLKWIQNLTDSYATDAAFWNYGRNLYLIMTQSRPIIKNASGLNITNLKTTIYKWAGTYFDIVQYLETKYAQRVVPFKIGSNQYLAIANFQDDRGDTNTYSDIYKFDVQSERFYLHQKILTNACTDIRFFSFIDEEKRLREDFLVVANSFEEGPKGEKLTTDSIIYKFIDGHFIPFQSIRLSGLEQFLPLEGPNGEFALLAFCKFDGMKVFQYDGWSFVETSLEYTSDIFKNNVQSIKFDIFNDNIILVIANGNNDGGDTNTFKLDFTHENKLNTFHVEMLSWCKNISKRLDELEAWEKNISNHLNQIENMPQKLTKKPAEGEDPAQQVRQAEAKTQENISTFKSDPEKIFSMLKDLSSYQSLLDSVESSLKQPPEQTKSKVLSKNLSADKIIISEAALVNLFNTDIINSINVTDLLDNTIDITQGLTTNGSIEFEELRLSKLISNPKSVNGHPFEDVLLTRDLKAFSIAIVGNATIGKNLYVDGDINNMKVDENHILLKTKNQEFERTNVKALIRIKNLETSTLNNFELKNETCKNIENLKTKNLFIDDGYINGISFRKLNKNVLRTSSNQNIKATLNFENLQADKLSVTNLLNEAYTPSNLINTDRGEYNIIGNLNFANDVTIRNLTIKKMLNNINVVDNKLDILLKKSPEKQHITGMKYFENLTLMNPVFLNGAFIEPGKPKINPVLDIYDDVIISKNLTIDGTVTIEKILKVSDIVTNDGQYSMNKLTENGLSLKENKIPIELSFSQQPNVAEIFADRINGINPGTWIVNGGNENQKVVGFKTFLGDLSISGSTTVRKVNNIDVKQLEQNVLTVDDDQEITAKHFMKHVITNSLTTNQTLYGGEKLEDLIHNSKENQIILKHLKAKSCSCQNLSVNGLMNELNFTQIAEDTITNKKDIRSIEGHTTFRNLKCKNLKTKNQSPDDIFIDPKNVLDEVIIDDSNIDLTRPIVVHNINFTGTFNGVEDNQIDNVKNQQITLERQSFKKITVFGQTNITSNSINGINIGSIANDTVKINEDLELESLTVVGSVKVENISLEGQIQGLDLENTVAPNSQQEQIILDEKVFSNDVIIRGNVSFNGMINGMEKTRFLNSVYPNPGKGKIIVKGNVTFAKGPIIDSLNNYAVEDLGKRVWFKDRSTVIDGEMNFSNIVFMDDISIKGDVDEVDLPLLNKTYFSKTKNQTVPGIIEFTDVTFDQTVTTPHVDLHGRINEIKLDEFERTVLLDDVDQIFEDLVSLENCQTEEAKGDYKVNGLDLEDDIMRYDRVNIVTGKKNIRFLNTNRLKIQKDIEVQNVKILETLEHTVLRNMPVRIRGKKTFTDRVSFYKNLSVHGGVNGRPFNSETVMLKDVPQTVTGKKTLLSNKTDPIELKSMKLKGLINNLSLQDVIKTQANKNEDNILETPINFHKDVTVNNLNIGKSYNGVNVTKLLTDVVTLNALTNFEDIYSNLLEKARRLYHSLQDQAYYLHYYKIVGNFKNVEVIPFTYNNKVDSLITFKNESGTTSVNFYEWDGTYNMYNAISFNMSMDYYPTYITKIKVYKKDCLYMEYPLTEVTNKGFSYNGTMYHVTEHDGHRKFLSYSEILSRKMRSLTVMTLPVSQEMCLVFVYDQSDNVNILCDIGRNDFQIHQTFHSSGVSKVTTVTTDGIPYIITINHQSQSQLTESTVNIWKFSLENRLFHPHQTIHAKSPIHVDTIYHERQYYLAIASGYLEKAVHAGSVHIRRFDKTSGFFEPYQILNLEAPIEVKFAVLPSAELVLYATTRNPSKPFIVYMYEGISGFVQKIVASAIEKAGFIKHFTNQANQHFILTGNEKEVNVIQAVFKGKKWTV